MQIIAFCVFFLLGDARHGQLEDLVKALKDPDPKIRLKAATALGNLRTKAKGAIPALLEALNDKDPAVRTRVIAGIGLISFQDEKKMLVPVEEIDIKIVRALIPFVEDKDVDVRMVTLSALGSCREKAKEAVPKLIPALKAKERGVRSMAANCLGAIGPEAKAALPHLQNALKDEEESVRERAREAIKLIQGSQKR
jgi:vesicle coat complex subunit